MAKQVVIVGTMFTDDGGSPPGYWGGVAPPVVSHPIAPGRPPGIWGGPPLYPDQGLPGAPPSPSPPIALPPGSISGTPEHPIYTPPGAPSHPIALPPNSVGGTPEQPIYYPPGIWPSPPGGKPPGIWGGPPLYPDQGLPVPPGSLPPLPEVPPELASSVIVAVHKPGQEWVVQTYPVTPGHPIVLPPVDPDAPQVTPHTA